jgi:hypothetical protein
MFMTVFTTPCKFYLSWARLLQSEFTHPNYRITFNIIVTSISCSSNCSPSFTFSHTNPLYTCTPSLHNCYSTKATLDVSDVIPKTTFCSVLFCSMQKLRDYVSVPFLKFQFSMHVTPWRWASGARCFEGLKRLLLQGKKSNGRNRAEGVTKVCGYERVVVGKWDDSARELGFGAVRGWVPLPWLINHEDECINIVRNVRTARRHIPRDSCLEERRYECLRFRGSVF